MSYDLSKIIQAINTGDYKKGQQLVQPLLQKDSQNFALNKILGVCLMSQMKYLKAIDAFNICYLKNTNDYDVIVNLSYLNVKIQDYKKGIEFSSKAISINDKRPEAYSNIAECCFFLSDYEKAEINILKAIEIRGGFNSKEIISFPDTLLLYANILLAKKDIDKFVEFAHDILDRGINLDEILIKLLRVDISHIKETYIKNLEKILLNINNIKPLLNKNIAEANAYFFLAEYTYKKDKSQSEDYYIKANRVVALMQRDSLFKRQNKIKNMLEAINSLDESQISKYIDPTKGKGLIFIIGMPRSGTTLLESVLSTADDICAGGEKLFFTLECNKILENYPSINLNLDFFKNLGDKYLDVIHIQRKGKSFFIDKLPENYIFYKFIKLSLPSAKFIHIFRDPWDNAISLFKQNYAANLFYASSFFGIALEYANYEFLINYWKNNQLDQKTFLDIDYKDLVNDTEGVAKKIWSYCGLFGKYEPNKRNKFFSTTASQQQVTKKIYKSSIKKADFTDFQEQFQKDLMDQREYWSNF